MTSLQELADFRNGYKKNGSFWWWDFVRQAVIWMIAVMVAYGAMSQRVAVLENRVDTLRADTQEIKADVKALIRMHLQK